MMINTLSLVVKLYWKAMMGALSLQLKEKMAYVQKKKHIRMTFSEICKVDKTFIFVWHLLSTV